MQTVDELLKSSLELESALIEYKKEENYDSLEKTLLDLVYTYEWLNFYKEDKYLENLINTYVTLAEVFFIKKQDLDVLNCYTNIIESYDDIIQRDRTDENATNKHVEGLKLYYDKFKELAEKLGVKNRIVFEYPRLKKYLG